MDGEHGPHRFDGKTALVTGSTRGIGAGIAHRLAAEGAAVVITGREETEGKRVAASIREQGERAQFVGADLRNPDEIGALVEGTAERFGGIDVLVNNAAVQTETAVDETGEDDWEFVVETNFRGYWRCAKYASEYMGRGAIVNISSNHAFSTMPSHFPYNAVKSGINGMTRAMALDWGPDIRVNTVNPGWVAVDRTESALTAEEREHLESIHPVGRIGQPADIAGTVAFLASDDAAFLTGSSILVDGGRGAVMQDDTLPNYASEQTDNSW